MTAMGARGKKTTGGNAMTFFPDMRLSINKVKKDSDERILQVEKSKCQAMPWTECSVTIRHNLGLDRLDSLITVAISKGYIKPSGSWMKMKLGTEDRSIQGRDNLVEFLRTNATERSELCTLLGVSNFEPRDYLVRTRIGDTNDNVEDGDGADVESG